MFSYLRDEMRDSRTCSDNTFSINNYVTVSLHERMSFHQDANIDYYATSNSHKC